MNGINHIWISLLLLLSVFSLSAQVATTVSDYPVVDLSGLSSLGCVLSSIEASDRRTQMNAQSPSNSAYLPDGAGVSGNNGTWNAKMSIKYQVMRADHTVGTTNWANAYTLCKGYNGEGGTVGNWRLPTQRELQMIWVLHPQLIGQGGFTAFSPSTYWSSMEGSASNAWCVYFGDGSTGGNVYKTNYSQVRCVRDL